MGFFPIGSGQHNRGYRCTGARRGYGCGDRSAFRWIDSQGARIDSSFADLDRLSNRFAYILESSGLEAGDVSFTFLPTLPEQFFAFLGALKARMICGHLFSNFGEEALLDRLGDSGVKGIITKNAYIRNWPVSATVFTVSVSTGKPKGVLHRHGSIDLQAATTRDDLGLKEGDLFWGTADQGWVTGTSYGIIGP